MSYSKGKTTAKSHHERLFSLRWRSPKQSLLGQVFRDSWLGIALFSESQHCMMNSTLQECNLIQCLLEFPYTSCASVCIHLLPSLPLCSPNTQHLLAMQKCSPKPPSTPKALSLPFSYLPADPKSLQTVSDHIPTTALVLRKRGAVLFFLSNLAYLLRLRSPRFYF